MATYEETKLAAQAERKAKDAAERKAVIDGIVSALTAQGAEITVRVESWGGETVIVNGARGGFDLNRDSNGTLWIVVGGYGDKTRLSASKPGNVEKAAAAILAGQERAKADAKAAAERRACEKASSALARKIGAEHGFSKLNETSDYAYSIVSGVQIEGTSFDANKVGVKFDRIMTEEQARLFLETLRTLGFAEGALPAQGA